MNTVRVIERFFTFWFTVRMLKIERERRIPTQMEMREVTRDMVNYLSKKGLVPPVAAFHLEDMMPSFIPHDRVLH